DWTAFYQYEHRQRTPLPTYAFERQRYWVDATLTSDAPVSGDAPVSSDASVTGDAADGAERRAATPRAGSGAVATDPVSSVEETVARIWSERLGVEPIGPHDNFFELGGTSIAIVEVIFAINRAFGLDLSALNLLEAPTVAGLSGCIRQVGG